MKIEQVEKFIGKQDVAFIASVDAEGYPNIKAMLAPRKTVGAKTIYFSTNTSSLKVEQFKANPKSGVYFYNKGLLKYEGLLLTGDIEVIEDQTTKDMLWQDGDEKYYSGGVTDPDYCVLKFVAKEGRYYSNLNSESFAIE